MPQEQQPIEVRRQEVLSRSPMLQSIISNTISEKQLQDSFNKIYDAVAHTYGRHDRRGDRQTKDIIFMKTQDAIDSFSLNHFVDTHNLEEDYGRETIFNIIGKVFVYTGFEIGNKADTEPFLKNMADFLFEFDTENNGGFFATDKWDLLEDTERSQQFFDAIRASLNAGIRLRELLTDLPQTIPTFSTEPDTSTPTQELTPEETDFLTLISGIDLSPLSSPDERRRQNK